MKLGTLLCGLLLTVCSAKAAAADLDVGDRCTLTRRIPLNAGTKKIRLDRDSVVEVIDVAKHRVQVRTSDGDVGFVNRKRLEKACDKVETPAPTAVTPEPKPEPPPTPPPEPAKADPPPPPAAPAEPRHEEAAASERQADPGPIEAPEPPAEVSPTEVPPTEVSPTEVPPTETSSGTGESHIIIASDVQADDRAGATETAVGAGTPVASAAGPRKTLLSSDLTTGYAGGLVIRGTSAGDRMGLMAGLRAAWVANHQLGVGAAAFVTALGPRFEDSGFRNDRDLFFFYGGLELTYTLTSSEIIHGMARGLVGAGGAGHFSGRDNDVYVGTDFFWVVEPGVEVVVDLYEALSVGVGVGYRFAPGVDLRRGVLTRGADAPNNLLNGVNVDLSVSYGVF